MPDPISESDRDQIAAELFAGRKIQAIKLYRTATGTDLKGAKDAVEAMERELRSTVPEQFTAQSAKGGCMTVIVLALAPAAIAVWMFASTIR